MAFNISVSGLQEAMDRFDDMGDYIQAWPIETMPDIFHRWQREDMKRTYPKIDEDSSTHVTTFIYPRSRRKRWGGEANKPKPRRAIYQRAPKRTKRARQAKGSKSPILRPFLFEVLRERMMMALRERLSWR